MKRDEGDEGDEGHTYIFLIPQTREQGRHML
jgi:hypothetical protein